MQELFKSSIENDVNHLYLSWRKNCTISTSSYKTVFTGWDSLQNKIISNTNGKITLEELYQYSYPLVLEAASSSNKEQHVSVLSRKQSICFISKIRS